MISPAWTRVHEHTGVTSPRSATTMGRWSPFGQWSLAVLSMILIVGADFAWQSRDQTASLSGQIDISVIVEFALYAVVGGMLLLRLFDTSAVGGRPAAVLVTMWVFTGAMCATATFSPYLELAATRSLQLVVVALLATVVARRGRRDELHRFVHLYLAVAVAVVPLGLLVHFPRSLDIVGRFRWLYVHPVIAANFLGLAVLMGLAYMLDRRRLADVERWHRLAYPIATGTVVTAIVLTRTRGALAATLVAAFVMVGVSRPQRRVDTVLVAALLGVVVVAFAGGDIVSFILRGESAEQIGTLNSRTDVWDQASSLISQAPWLGHGFMAARGLFLEQFDLGGAHNAAFEVLVNAGIVGFVTWLAMIFAAVAATRRVGRARGGAPAHPDGPLLCGMVTFLLVNCISTGQLGQAANAQNVVFFIILGWLVAIPRWSTETT